MRALLLPVTDLLAGMDGCARAGRSAILWLFGGLLLGWWIYVPLHELLHAFGCLAAGGEVTRLEIQAKYGGGILAGVFPWVVSGGEYAGRLSGFDTFGNDLIYLVTDLAPFVLTIFPGVWAWRRSGRKARPFWFGFFCPFALAPLLSVTGDAYEIASILVTSLPSWSDPILQDYLRGDDVFQQYEELRGDPDSHAWFGFYLAVIGGVIWAFSCYYLAAGVARLGGERSGGGSRGAEVLDG